MKENKLNRFPNLTPEEFSRISPNDNMCRNPNSRSAYFGVGLKAIAVICSELERLNLKPKYILDIPCGYGRITRFLKAVFTSAEIYACDIDKEGVDFCSRTFDIWGQYSQINFIVIRAKCNN